MAGPPSDAFRQVSWIFTGVAVPHGAACSLGFDKGSEGLADAAAVIGNEAATLHEALSTSNVTLASIVVKEGPNETGPSVEIPLNVPGDQGVDTAPPQVSYLIRKQVNNVTQRLSGRLYWPGVPITTVDEAGGLDPATVTQVDDAWIAFLDVLNDTLEMNPYVFPATSSDPRSVSFLRCQGTVATQRRRLRR